MSIILGPYDNAAGGGSAEQHGSDDCEELFVFGYACKLFRDDDKGLLESSGQMLIPWMGDGSLMVDRYDIRNRLEDKSQFGLKPILPRRRTDEEEELEEQLDHERYLALGVDILEHELLEEETKKRAQERSNSYQAVGFSYESVSAKDPTTIASVPPVSQRPEHPPTSSVDVAEGEEDVFVLPEGLVVPGHIKTPASKKLHSIIERTAGFVAVQGTQMEIMIKAKQKYNPFFSFVSLYDPLHTYYRHLLQMIASGKYSPKQQAVKDSEEVEKSEVGGGVIGGDRDGVRREGRKGTRKVSETGEDESDPEDSDEEFELHPLLRLSTTPRSSPKPPSTSNPHRTTTTPSASIATTQSNDHHNPAPPSANTSPSVAPSSTVPSFYSKSLTVNSAPSLDREQRDVLSPHGGSYPYPSTSFESHRTVAPHDQQQPPYHHPNAQYHFSDGYSYHHPQPSDYASQSSLEAYYHRLSAEHISNKMGASGPYPPPFGHNAGPPPPPPDLQPIIDKTAEYVARNSEEFERTVLEKHCGDPKFGFLNPWNKHYPYYKLKLQQNKEKMAEEALAAIEKDFQREETQKGEKIQKLSETGTVSFKLQPKKVAKVLETEAVDFGPAEDEEEENENQTEDVAESRGQCVPEEEYQTTEGPCQGSGQDMSGYHDEDVSPQAPHDHSQSFPEDHVHYSAERTYYYPNSNGECEDDQPAAKRAKTAADDTVVMDNKVQEFLSQVKAVLDT